MGNASSSSETSESDEEPAVLPQTKEAEEMGAQQKRAELMQKSTEAITESEAVQLERANDLRETLRSHPHFSAASERKMLAGLLEQAQWQARQTQYNMSGSSPFERLPPESIEIVVKVLAAQIPERQLSSYALVSRSMATEIRRHRWKSQDVSHASRASLRRLIELAPNVGHFLRNLVVTNAVPQGIFKHAHNLQHLGIGVIDRHVGRHLSAETTDTLGEALIKAQLKLTHFHLFNYQLPSRDHDAETRSSMIAMKRSLLPIFTAMATWKTLQVVDFQVRSSRACYRAGIRALAELPLLEELSITAGTAGWRKHPPSASALLDVTDTICFPRLRLFRGKEIDLNEISFLGPMQLVGSTLERIELYQPRIKEWRQPIEVDLASSSSDSDGDENERHRRRINAPARRRTKHSMIPREDRMTGVTSIRIANAREHDSLQPYLLHFADLPSIQTIEVTVRTIHLSRSQLYEQVMPAFKRFPALQLVRLLTSVASPKEENIIFEALSWGRTTQKEHKRAVKKLRAALKEIGVRLEVEDEEQFISTLPVNHRASRHRRDSDTLAGIFDGVELPAGLQMMLDQEDDDLLTGW